MNWDDVSTEIRTLFDAVPPVEADEVLRDHERPAMPDQARPTGRAWRKPTLAAAASILVAAAVWTATTSGDDDPGPDVATASATDATGPTDANLDAQSDTTDTGPLSLINFPFTMQAETTGTLEITGDCTFLRISDRRDLLVWPAGRTTWVPESGTIRVRSLDGRPPLDLADGDTIHIDGGYWLVTGPNAGPLDWVVEPSPSCGADEAWLVGESVELLPG